MYSNYGIEQMGQQRNGRQQRAESKEQRARGRQKARNAKECLDSDDSTEHKRGSISNTAVKRKTLESQHQTKHKEFAHACVLTQESLQLRKGCELVRVTILACMMAKRENDNNKREVKIE
jgi:hypothetical protein